METRALAWELQRAAAPAPSLAPEAVGPMVLGAIPPFKVFGVAESVEAKGTAKCTADLGSGDGVQASFDLEGVFGLASGLPVDIHESECVRMGPEGSEDG